MRLPEKIALLLLLIALIGSWVYAQSPYFNSPGKGITSITAPGCSNGSILMWGNSAMGCATGTPTVTSCGSGPSVSGTDMQGVISTGTGIISACTLNFSHTLSGTPRCLISTSIGAAWISSITSSAMTITAVTLTSSQIWYHCWNAI